MNKELESAYQRVIRRIRLQDEVVSDTKELYDISSINLDADEKEILWIKRVKHLEKQYELGHVAESFYVYNVMYLIENIIHDNRWLNGKYDNELKPISKKIKKIEDKYGSKNDEYWNRNYGPPNQWRRLNKKYERILDKKLLEIFDELKYVKIKEIYLKDNQKYLNLVEKGRREVFEKNHNDKIYNELLTQFRAEFERCKKIKAYYSATIMTGSILELMLLKISQNKIGDLKPIIKKIKIENKRKISNNPLDWSLKQLLEIAEKSKLFPNIQINDDIEISIIDIGNIIRNARNLIHPGNHIKRNMNILEGNNFKDIEAYYEIINNIFAAIDNVKDN